MLHRGTVDNAPDISDMLRYHCIRYLTICKIVDSHAIQIHCPNAIIIGSIATALALKDMQMLVTIGLLGVSADWTGLACITGIHVNNGTFVKSSLVLQLLLKVIERPRDGNIAAFATDTFRCRTDAGQVFKNKECMLRVTFNECL